MEKSLEIKLIESMNPEWQDLYFDLIGMEEKELKNYFKDSVL